jgi:hypothetical protein
MQQTDLGTPTLQRHLEGLDRQVAVTSVDGSKPTFNGRAKPTFCWRPRRVSFTS